MVNKNYLHSDITDKIIRSAIKVHKALGPGLVEKLYQRALKIELLANKIKAERERRIEMQHEGKNIGFDKVDFDVQDKVLVELKAGPNSMKYILPKCFPILSHQTEGLDYY